MKLAQAARGSQETVYTQPLTVKYALLSVHTGIPMRLPQVAYLSTCCKGNPSRRHSILGVGLPLAMHFSDTDGPGCIVCSENLKSSTGRASKKTGKKESGWLSYSQFALEGFHIRRPHRMGEGLSTNALNLQTNSVDFAHKREKNQSEKSCTTQYSYAL